MIKILQQDDELLLKYESDGTSDVRWIDEKLQREGSVTIRRVFTFDANSLVKKDDPDSDSWTNDDRTFVLGIADNAYYKVGKDILGLKHDLFLSRTLKIRDKTFVASRDISIFRRIDDLIEEPIAIGGDKDGAIPLEEFEELLRNFPTSTELTHYARARITRVLKDYFGTMSDAQEKLDKYLNKERTIKAASTIEFIQDFEPKKFEFIRDELREMLIKADSYAEKDWQNLIVSFLLLIFPKYIAVLENLHIKDFYSDPKKTTDRYIDLTLVDANGTIDIIEIKKPFANCLLSANKYRDNFTPKKELSGSVMQVEKYIFHLNKWGRNGELEILKKRAGELPPNFEIKVTNPKAIIILGRDSDFSDEQKFDFEIIKRKYANIMDIMTYDDLLRRLDNIILMIGKNHSKLNIELDNSSDVDVKK